LCLCDHSLASQASHSLDQRLGQLFSPGFLGGSPGMELAPKQF
jgi:hypothetical protein